MADKPRPNKKVLVIVPFPVGEEHLDLRRHQHDCMNFGPDIDFHYKPVSVGGRNLISPYE